ncbi:hypothetical protein CANARDRAFT_26501 [[Candida] arabinofermentans NRRL YB-2248]|uniref:Exocyst complex component SEC15 n=1 Tax=[Candida] arabinofermentans NRRL YB-2248 TaxID=983967 RepID=A0A1E4T5W5_9ASCO|nr:hypothetical protein CANARDRAFT_26501 [[Candida] arabinofermentans NRRL YB-2248]
MSHQASNGNVKQQLNNQDGGTTTKDYSLIQYALGSDDYLDKFVPILKAELLSKKSLDGLIRDLNDISKNKEETLEGISFNSVDDLANSMDTISNIVQSSSDLSQEIMSINSELSKTGIELTEKKRLALDYKRLYNKINETEATINSCLDMLDKMNKVLDLVEAKEFYKALMNLNLLSRSHIENIENFEFTKRIYNSIPAIKNVIIDETLNQLIRWFNISLEKNLTTIGELLFENFNTINQVWSDKQLEDLNLIRFKINSPIEKTLRLEEFKFFDPLRNDEVQIDLDPIYHSILVFQSINEFDRLKDDFSNELLRKRDRLIYPIKDALASNNLDLFANNDSLKVVIFSLTAFFVADRLITAKTEYLLRSKKQSDDLFESVISKFIPILRRHIEKNKHDGQKLKELNNIIGLFIQVLENYDFNIDPLYQQLMYLFELYVETSIDTFKNDYLSLAAEENPQPLTVQNESQLKTIQSCCFYVFRTNKVTFPITFPFSVIYAATCSSLRDFIRNIYEFLSLYYNHKTSTLLRIIGNSVDQVLIGTILKDLDQKINSEYKEIVAQNLINLEFFSNSVIEIEKYLNFSSDPLILKLRSPSSLIKLRTEAEFRRVRTKAEEGMFELVDSKTGMLFEMLEFDWESKEVNDEPSIGIKDMSLFLKNIFMLDFSHLPYSIKSLLLIRTFDKLVTFLKTSIFQAQFITAESVKNFEIDINYIETIIPSLTQESRDERQLVNENESSNLTLETIFSGLKQIIELLKEGNLEGYKEDKGRMRKYNSIRPEEAIELVQKLEDYQNLMREMEINEATERSNGDGIDDEPTRTLFSIKRASTGTTTYNNSPAKISSMFSFKKPSYG